MINKITDAYSPKSLHNQDVQKQDVQKQEDKNKKEDRQVKMKENEAHMRVTREKMRRTSLEETQT